VKKKLKDYKGKPSIKPRAFTLVNAFEKQFGEIVFGFCF
jgi:hypothetical protein